MVMEYVNGETLLERLGRGGRLRWREALSFMTQLLSALDYAHRGRAWFIATSNRAM